ncbi:MAG: DEAD/DEAH box helicase family protein [Saprospiraceae bacterium]
MVTNPILNSPYEEPTLHYATDLDGSLNYNDIREGRRIFTAEMQSIPVRQIQGSIFEVNDLGEEYGEKLVNLLRKQVGLWRESKYSNPNPTRVTKELLLFWFENPDRHAIKKLFFCQREAIETAIWLNEIADKSNAGQHILNRIREAQQTVSGSPELQLPRIAFKMATGTGKTVVMGALILYHFFNREEYRQDTRFADNFLLVAPGITIRDRLKVLEPDSGMKSYQDATDYYHIRGLVPQHYEEPLKKLKSKIVITNYHTFEPRTLKGNKQSPFDGKLDSEGNKQEAKEDMASVIRRVMGKFKTGSRLLILNDEAHHCYLPKEKGKNTEGENTQEENARAAVWFTGIAEIYKRYKVSAVYDLSATPYYLTGSGYPSYSLFPWVVTDFGLIEAIEAGLVKIPFLPESDSTQRIEMPVLRNLYEHVKEHLPKKGQRGKRKADKEEGKEQQEEPPKLPATLKLALDQFYNHYKKEFEAGRTLDAEDTPPVFIAVCNNTSVSKEVYKFIAGYEIENKEGEIDVVTGHYELFSNYDKVTRRPLRKSPTLLIDSDALENSDQVGDDFKKIFASEIETFKREYAKNYGAGSAERITDAEILREVVNTVGKPGKLGSHIRCVVSVSMLTEGWDANTVTHIMGLRAFGSQLLCEQVAGRALRRKQYYLQNYSRETGEYLPPEKAKRYKPENIIQKFPPEYAHIIGVPFRIFKGGTTEPPPKPEHTTIRALPERLEQFEITFPNIIGYREEVLEDGDMKFDFTGIEDFEIDGANLPVFTTLASAFSNEEHRIQVESVLEKRDQSVIYWISNELLKYKFADDDGNPYFQKFNQVKEIVRHWYENKIRLINLRDPKYKRLVHIYEAKKVCDHIYRGINPHRNTSEFIRPVFNHYNRFGSTRYVHGLTTKPVFPTKYSHVNFVVADTDSWEQIAAKSLEELVEEGYVLSYVKNAFLDFKIPYVKDGEDKNYITDFIARCQTPSGKTINLMIEITGMNQEKQEKKWFVENRWLPAVNAVREKYEFDEWAFLEVAMDIRDVKNQIIDKINS